jgi:molybdopterin-guanine dinucleotide biosynthesis protein A
MKLSQPVAGILLAGGRSSRMGGGDKCLRQLGGRPVLSRIIERLRPQISDMVLNANGDPSRFASFGLSIVADSIEGFAGPLAGIHAGLAWIRQTHPEIAYGVTVATDTPFFPDNLVARLLTTAAERPALVVARSEQGVHPVIGLWPVALADEIERFLRSGNHKVGRFVEEQCALEVEFPPVDIGGRKVDPFFNINRPEDLAEAEALLKEHSL